MRRFDWIDNSKSILILLIILGHFHYIDTALFGKNLIYAIHVPGFLIITGFLLSSKFGQMDFSAMLRRWIGVYVRAYIFFSLFAIALWWAVDIVKTHSVNSPMKAIVGAIYGVAGPYNWLVHIDQPLWYLPFLVTSMIGAWVAARLASRIHIAIGWIFVLAYASVAIFYDGIRLPWDLDIAGMGSTLIFFGYQMRRHYEMIEPLFDHPARALPTAILFGAIAFTTSLLNGTVNINGAEFGSSGAIFLLTAICGSLSLMLFCSLIASSRIARIISVNTLTIFAIHIYLIRIAARLPHLPGYVGTQITMLLYAIIILLACLPLANGLKPVLDRFVNRKPLTARTAPNMD